MDIISYKEDLFTKVTIQESRLDASNAPEFKTQIINIIERTNSHVILNFESVRFMDSSSLGALVSILKKMNNTNNLILIGVNGVVLELFKLTKMINVFYLAEDLDEAISKFIVEETSK